MIRPTDSADGCKPKLIFHIGWAKTGSTSLQDSFHANYRLLRREGVYFPERNDRLSLDKELYGALMLEVFNKDAENVTNALANQIKSAYRQSKASVLLLSDEKFSNTFGSEPIYSASDQKTYRHALFNPEFIKGYAQRIKALFSDFDITIVAYLRRQDLLFESHYNQNVKMNYSNELGDDNIPITRRRNISSDLIAQIIQKNGYPLIGNAASVEDITDFQKYCICQYQFGMYYKMLSVWAEIFGRENIKVIPFERSQFNRGLIKDFYIDILNIKTEKVLSLSEDERNQSINRDLVEYFVKYMPYNSLLWNEVNMISHKLKERNKYKQLFTDEERRKFIHCYEEENRLLATTFLRRKDGVLFYDKVKNNPAVYPGLDEKTSAFIRHEIEHKKNCIHFIRRLRCHLWTLCSFKSLQEKITSVCGFVIKKVMPKTIKEQLRN